MKIYRTDSNLRYQDTKKKAIDSKRDIDGELGRWGITKVLWQFDLTGNEVWVEFQITELFKEVTVKPMIHLDCPVIWKKIGRGKNPREVGDTIIDVVPERN